MKTTNISIQKFNSERNTENTFEIYNINKLSVFGTLTFFEKEIAINIDEFVKDCLHFVKAGIYNKFDIIPQKNNLDSVIVKISVYTKFVNRIF